MSPEQAAAELRSLIHDEWDGTTSIGDKLALVDVLTDERDRLLPALRHARRFANEAWVKSQSRDSVESELLEIIHAADDALDYEALQAARASFGAT